ncbi:MAG: hypothetical protein II296_00740 [Bacteroidaceae bacterium]|nr:hypothetical protein [Bacteroidaceae bacterium]
MILCIADLLMDIRGTDAAERLPNLAPFVVEEQHAKERNIICTIEVGKEIAPATSAPTLTSTAEGRTTQVWLTPEHCKITLKPDNSRSYQMQATRDWKKVATDWQPGTQESYAALNDLTMIAFVYSSALHGTATIHASCVAVGDKACAFIGPSGVGKSTHAALWLQHIEGARLLNDDQPAIRPGNDGRVHIYGTPWSGKTPCYRNEKATLSSIFFMEQSRDNSLTTLGSIETFQQLMKATSLIGRDTITFKEISSTQAKAASLIPAYTLKNTPGPEALALSHGAFTQSNTLQK